MNHSLLALLAATTLVGATALPAATPAQAAPLQADAAVPVTVVIRYDPEMIGLTHWLVAPLCSREVSVKPSDLGLDVDLEGSLGLTAYPAPSNDAQPPGVFVGRFVAHVIGRDPETTRLDPAVEAAAIDRGLDQLRSALEKRLVAPRMRRVEERIASLRAVQARTTDQLEQASVRATLLEVRAVTEARLADAQAERKRVALELQVAERELDASMARLDESRAMLDATTREVDEATAKLEDQLQKLFEQGLTSAIERERQLASRKAESAARIAALTARTDSSAIKVEQNRAVIEQALQQMRQAEESVNSMSAEISKLPAAADGPAGAVEASELGLRREVLASQAKEIALELQALEAQRVTIGSVTVERW